MVRFDPHLTEMIIFDLEFHVPAGDRSRRGASLMANPYRDGHQLLGGVFCRYQPLRDGENDLEHRFEHHWSWRAGGERAVLEAIFSTFQAAWQRLSAKDPSQADLIAVGIGIAWFDLPVLFARCQAHGIAPADRLFDCFFKLKVVDLSNVGIGLAGEPMPVLYPRSANQLLKQFGLDGVKRSGRSVWEMFDAGQHAAIEARTEREVRDMVRLYRAMQGRLGGAGSGVGGAGGTPRGSSGGVPGGAGGPKDG